ncbi:MAG: hypothetical protein A2289_10405 [Deltaproteobacteria bacterium RIFOXYA12_FULL_58_15]|nr:MAG: hypothetical protein A2289_10405 [Deltaproteobacteria bacterium RIFOXYA12_FULL_58_15]OGR13140.1 MAG: hypothetical protein A2341_08565 [Deltaproteobacteria bacterium RIFOXYB12_FULL_58_9]
MLMTMAPHPHSNSTSLQIGWCEYVGLPKWGVNQLRAKIDTGARSSALHVANLKKLTRNRVAFDVVLHRDLHERCVHVVAPVVRRASVRPTTGKAQRRYFVKTTLHLGDTEREIEISLIDRGEMRFRMILGRTALHGIIVNVSQRYALGREKKNLQLAKKKTTKAKPK